MSQWAFCLVDRKPYNKLHHHDKKCLFCWLSQSHQQLQNRHIGFKAGFERSNVVPLGYGFGLVFFLKKVFCLNGCLSFFCIRYSKSRYLSVDLSALRNKSLQQYFAVHRCSLIHFSGKGQCAECYFCYFIS